MKSGGASARQGSGPRGIGLIDEFVAQARRARSWLDTPWPWARNTTWREFGRFLAASRPQSGGVSQS